MNLYSCVVCGSKIDPKGAGTYQQVTCWIPVGKTSGVRKTDPLYRYAHRVCVESPPKGQEETLF